MSFKIPFVFHKYLNRTMCVCFFFLCSLYVRFYQSCVFRLRPNEARRVVVPSSSSTAKAKATANPTATTAVARAASAEEATRAVATTTEATAAVATTAIVAL